MEREVKQHEITMYVEGTVKTRHLDTLVDT